MLSMEIGAKCAWVCRTICTKRPCRFSLEGYSGSLLRGRLRDRPELFSYLCYSRRDLRPIVSLTEQNSHLLDRRGCAIALHVLDDLANLLLKLFFAAH